MPEEKLCLFQGTTIFQSGERENIKVACSWLFHMLLSQYFSLKLFMCAAGLDRRSVKEASFEDLVLSNVLFRLLTRERNFLANHILVFYPFESIFLIYTLLPPLLSPEKPI